MSHSEQTPGPFTVTLFTLTGQGGELGTHQRSRQTRYDPDVLGGV